ncbi:hypothetical protein LTR70_002042 [Exophiala xenobiotica]|uniref:Carbonic anhydrase n=1 Tax=Lithohypha guttulata TaxID=1690604 RepID=A0ABR0KBN5_9EURO|nr:hypothetical protein LTR24_004633 [Lithohypha guttulata]KAK5326278.1 hypothetical protein LTR70_002042 [Exophiala xenobiotica]
MSHPPTASDLIARNTTYQPTHHPTATLSERFASGLKGPTVAIIACPDPRCIPETFLNLTTWDAVVIRTAGSNVTAALPTLIAIDKLVGLQEIMVVNHTDCGALMYRDDEIRETLRARAPRMAHVIEQMAFGEITGTLEDRVTEHVAIARRCELLRQELREKVTGYIYDLKDGSLKHVN